MLTYGHVEVHGGLALDTALVDVVAEAHAGDRLPVAHKVLVHLEPVPLDNLTRT